MRAMTAEPCSMPQSCWQGGRPNAAHAGADAGRSNAPASVDEPFPWSVRLYSRVYTVARLALRSWQAAKLSASSATRSAQGACAVARRAQWFLPSILQWRHLQWKSSIRQYNGKEAPCMRPCKCRTPRVEAPLRVFWL